MKAAAARIPVLRPGVRPGILAHIGQTPLVRLEQMVPPSSAEVFVKCEHLNPGGSIKDRVALAMIEAAEAEGHLTPGRSTIIEATSGNTGIGLALVCAVKGYRLILAMPDNMSRERLALLGAYGAEIHLTPAAGVMQQAVQKAASLAMRLPDSFVPQQFSNRHNAEAHRRHTGPEILHQLARFGGLRPDAFVAGVGTGGTITGVGRTFRVAAPRVRLVAVEPEASAVLLGGRPGPHQIHGIGAGFVPDLLERALLSETRAVSEKEADRVRSALARQEGLMVGISSGAAVKVALDIARELGPGKVVVTIAADGGERGLGGADSR